MARRDVIVVDQVAMRQIQRRMAALPGRVNIKVLGQATSAATTPVLKSAKQKAPVETGLLKKSLGKKLKKYKRNAVAVCIVGPRSGFKDEGTGRNPANYAHLVELGTTHSAPKPFLRPALDENKSKIISKFESKMRSGIERETQKLARS